ncbi:MAG TPA: hypothetical protein EYO33_19765 [Phycisphaerales bacterium]|nr:hypothetical protein [Phycisphaerales bacterium]
MMHLPDMFWLDLPLQLKRQGHFDTGHLLENRTYIRDVSDNGERFNVKLEAYCISTKFHMIKDLEAINGFASRLAGHPVEFDIYVKAPESEPGVDRR